MARETGFTVFGYAHGHDILYPGFYPLLPFSEERRRLKEAIDAVHRKGQNVSFYLNLRIADKNFVDNDFKLKDSIFKDPIGKVVIEEAP